MVICCAAVNCSNRQGKVHRGAVSFHRFPLKDSKRLIQWLKAVQRDNWTPTKYSFLCSEHFTKDSFSKRLEDQHRLLKPTAVPTIFQLTEKKVNNQDYVKSRIKIASRISVRDGDQPREGGCKVVQRTSFSDKDFMVMQGTKEMDQVTLQAEIGSMSEQGENVCGQLEGPLRRMLADNLLTKTGLQRKPERPSVGDSSEPNVHTESWITDRSGVSIDDFTPPVSGACKFIGSLHSYSFSSKHTREKPSFPKEQLEKKRPKRDVEPSCSSNIMGHNKSLAESSLNSSLTATPQKPSQSLSASPADLTPQPATEAVVGQKGDTDANPMSINEVIISASGACKLIDSLHSYCFSSRQSKSEVCCLREQVEKKNGELKLLRQKINRSDSQVKKLKEKLDELAKMSFPYLNSLLSQDCETPQLNPVIEPLSWMLGTWLSDPPGDGDFPTMKPFQYLEEVHISHVGQPMLNFSFNAFHPDTRKPMHRECGFIRLKPDTNKVAFISAQNTGLVEVEEGEVNGQELSIASHSIARISFAKKPHVEQKNWCEYNYQCSHSCIGNGSGGPAEPHLPLLALQNSGNMLQNFGLAFYRVHWVLLLIIIIYGIWLCFMGVFVLHQRQRLLQITRKFRLNSDGKLEQTVSMATTTQPMTQHLHITYKKVTP